MAIQSTLTELWSVRYLVFTADSTFSRPRFRHHSSVSGLARTADPQDTHFQFALTFTPTAKRATRGVMFKPPSARAPWLAHTNRNSRSSRTSACSRATCRICSVSVSQTSAAATGWRSPKDASETTQRLEEKISTWRKPPTQGALPMYSRAGTVVNCRCVVRSALVVKTVPCLGRSFKPFAP